MGSAAKISIAIEAQTASLQKGFAEAKGAISSLAGGMSGAVASGMMKANVAIAAVKAGIGAMQGAFNEAMESINRGNQTGLFAQRIGMGVEALQALRYAAEMNGSSMEVLDGALQKMSTQVALAAQGTGEAKAALEQLGFSAQALNGLQPDQQFMAIADAISQMSNQGDRAAAAMKIFGEQGVQLNSVLALGSAGLAEWGAKAEEAGVINEASVERSMAAAKALKELNIAWTAFKDTIITYVLPAITSVIKGFNMMIDGIKAAGRWLGFGKKDGDNPLKPMADSAKTALKAVKDTTEAVKQTEKTAKKAAGEIKKSWADIPKPQDYTTPSVGAVTRGTVSGFSAYQEGLRAEKDRRRYEQEMLVWQSKIVNAVKDSKSGVTLATVNI